MIIYGTDLVQFYYWIEHYVRAVRSFSLQQLLWNPWNFLGFPFLFNLEYGALNPIMLLAPILGTANFINFEYILSLSIAFLGSYLFVSSSLSLGKPSGLVAGLIFVFNGFTFPRIYAGHLNILTTYCWIPISLYLITSWIESNKIKYLILWLTTLYLQLTSGFVNIFIFSFAIQICWLGMVAYENRGQRIINLLNIKNIIITTIFTTIFLLVFINFSHVLSESQRSMKSSFVFSSSYSMPIENLSTLFFPDRFGNPIYQNSRLFDQWYFGNFNYWELSGFVGLGTMLLVFLSIFSKRKKIIYFVLLCFLGIFLSLGDNTPVFPWFFKWFSFYRYIRIPSQHLVIFVFASSILAGYGTNVLLKIRSAIPFISFCSLCLFSTAVTTVQIARNYLSDTTNIYYTEDFGDLSKKGIDQSKMKNIYLVKEPGWERIGTKLLSQKGISDSLLVFEVPVANFHTVEVVISFINEAGIDVSYSDDQTHWNDASNMNKDKVEKLKIGLPYHAMIFRPFSEKIFIRISKMRIEDLVGMDKITIVSY